MSKIKSPLLLFALFFLFSFAAGQHQLQDPCFSTSPNGKNIVSQNLKTLNADVLEWNGQSWDGANKNAAIDKAPITPPYCLNPVKAVWMGNGTSWNQFGEGVSFKLKNPLSAFETYTFIFVYASAGSGSDGKFAPELSTSVYGDHIGYTVGRLNPADTAWRTDSITFTASAKQDGDFWITLHTRSAGSSGIVLAQCPQPKLSIIQDKKACNNQVVTLSTEPAASNYLWSDASTQSTLEVDKSDIYAVQAQTPCGLASDTLVLEFEDCGPGIGVPAPKGKAKGGGLNWDLSGISFKLCWFGACDDDDVPNGPPSPPIKIYNVLTPNGDGINDVFEVEGIIEGRWKVRIFNRYGQMVFEDLEYKNTWTPELPAGVYYVVIKDRNSDAIHKTTLTILR